MPAVRLTATPSEAQVGEVAKTVGVVAVAAITTQAYAPAGVPSMEASGVVAVKLGETINARYEPPVP